MSTAPIVTVEPALPPAYTPEPTLSVNPASVLQMILSSGKDVNFDNLTKLLELQERYDAAQERREANEARKAFHAAMAQFKRNAPTILKNKKAGFDSKRTGETVSYDYVDLANICETIIPALAEVGITHKFVPSNQTTTEITITCVLTHELGYSDPEPPSFRGPMDTSGTKNALQAMGSSASYLEKYSLLAAVGMAAKGQDNDGHGATEDAPTAAPDPIMDAKTLPELQEAFLRLYAAAKKDGNADAMKAIGAAKDKRKKELENAK